MVNVIGVMSGTSLDGIDVCLVQFTADKFKIVNYIEIDYSQEIKQKIMAAINDQMTISQLTSLDYELGYEYSHAIKLALDQWQIDSQTIDLIANHGQTIYHNDQKSGTINSTLQLGCGDIIKSQLGISVVTNFRAADIAVGNKGAPLVQLFDQYLIEQLNLEHSCFLNIGGIANIYIDDIKLSVDTGPGNMLINYAVKQLYGLEYDRDGQIAASGQVNHRLLSELMNHPYFKNELQLSTGREDFGDDYGQLILEQYRYLPKQDVVCTLTKFTADSISHQVLSKISDQNATIYLSGGGAYNPTLIKFLTANFENIKVVKIDEIGVAANLKEAAAFAYFGYMNISNKQVTTLNGNKTILGVLHKRGNNE